jgi:hypothetical protein
MRRLLVFLDREAYQRLANLARAEERAIDQQAAFLLRQALRQHPPHPRAHGAGEAETGCCNGA